MIIRAILRRARSARHVVIGVDPRNDDVCSSGYTQLCARFEYGVGVDGLDFRVLLNANDRWLVLADMFDTEVPEESPSCSSIDEDDQWYNMNVSGAYVMSPLWQKGLCLLKCVSPLLAVQNCPPLGSAVPEKDLYLTNFVGHIELAMRAFASRPNNSEFYVVRGDLAVSIVLS